MYNNITWWERDKPIPELNHLLKKHRKRKKNTKKDGQNNNHDEFISKGKENEENDKKRERGKNVIRKRESIDNFIIGFHIISSRA